MSEISLRKFFEELNIEKPKEYELQDFFEETAKIIDYSELPYQYETSVEQRGDGSGYETFYVFKRKSDGKYFFYYIYDGMIEVHELEECKKEVVEKWDFECTY